MIAIAFVIISLLGSATAYTTPSAPCSRRDTLANLATGTLFGIGALASKPVIPSAEALEICPAKANNCVRKAWTPPSGTSKGDAVKALRDAIDAYPQEGQADVDGGGWAFAEDDLSKTGLARLEFSSSGKGKFAKFFNGGRPFVDDLNLEVEETGLVQVKSQSRVGDSDFGVNEKRVNYLAKALKAKGWSV